MTHKEDILYSAVMVALQETERNEFSDEEEELEEEENAEIILLGLLSFCEERYLAPEFTTLPSLWNGGKKSFQPTTKKDLKNSFVCPAIALLQ